MKIKILSLAIVLALTGCQDNNKAAENANTNTNTSTDTSTANTVTINNASEPESLDPHLAQGVQESNIIRQFSEGLLSTDSDGNLIAGMATEWSSDDNKVWTFKLRDANWSNGDPVTAQDFVYSFQRLVNPMTASPYSSYLEDAKILNASDVINDKMPVDALGIKALDDKTLEITLSEPVSYFTDMLTHTSVQPVHQKTVETFGDKWTDPANIVVNGAYIPKLWNIGEKITLERNPAYYNDAATTIQSVTFLPISSSTTDVQRYKAGEIDVTASELPSEQFEDLKANLGEELKTGPTLCTYYYQLNHSKAPFDDERVRRALKLTLNRETIADKVLGQGQMPAYQFTPTAIKGKISYTPNWKTLNEQQRIDEAKALLSEAGYSATNPLKFTLLYDTNESHKKIALAATSIWKQHLDFVDVELVNQEWKTYLDSRRNGDYQMARARWCGDYNESSTFLNLLKSDSSHNWARYSNRDYDTIINQTVTAGTTDEQRKALYEQAEALLDKDSVQIDVLYYANVRLVKPYVVGYNNTDPLDNFQIKYWKIHH